MLYKICLEKVPQIITAYLVNITTVTKNEQTHLYSVHSVACFDIPRSLQVLLLSLVSTR